MAKRGKPFGIWGLKWFNGGETRGKERTVGEKMKDGERTGEWSGPGSSIGKMESS